MRPHLLSYILTSPWAITQDYALGYLPIIARALRGEIVPVVKDEELEPYSATPSAAPGQQKQTLVMQIRGAITKYDQECGPRGMESYGRWLEQAYADNSINGIVLKIDSGGGEGNAMFHLTNILSKRNKPVVALVDGMAASAAYGIAAATDEVILSGKTNMVGSIGTFITMMDVRGYFEKEGIKLHEVYATKSTEKNQEYLQALEGNYKPLKANLLDPFNELFHSEVKANRPGLDKTVFAGRTYMAEEAISLGLADGMGNMEFAVQRVQDLSKSFQSSVSMGFFTKNKPAAQAKTWDAVSALTAESTDEQIDAANQELFNNGAVGLEIVRNADLEASQAATKGLEDRIAAQNDQIAQLTAANTTLQSGLAETESQLAAANTRLAGYVEGGLNTNGKQDDGDGKGTPKLTGSDFKVLAADHPHLFPSLSGK